MTTQPTPDSHHFFVTCSKSLESLLEQELTEVGATALRQTVAGVYFEGPLETAYRAAMYSRVANRIILILNHQAAGDADALYDAADAIDWSDHLPGDTTFSITAAGTHDELRHTQFIAQRVKDAVVDQFRNQGLPRPQVDREAPGLRIHAVLKRRQVMLGVELTRHSLHRRGYRLEQGAAPMKETLAAALLYRAGWPALMKQPDTVIFDPLCGAGTLLIEAALMALDVAPGLLREGGFSDWLHHDSVLIEQVHREAIERRDAAADWQGVALGSDQDLRVLGMARRNAERAGVWDHVEVVASPVAQANPEREPTLLITNPPYGERLSNEADAMRLYQELGELIQRIMHGARAAIFTARPEWGQLIGIHSHRQYALFNGALPAKLLLFDVNDQSVYKNQRQAIGDENEVTSAALDDGGQMLANRLRKNLKRLDRWARQSDISCYRLYDADIPEFAFAIDLYTEETGQRYAHLQEYRPPATVNEVQAALRRKQALLATQHVLELSSSQVSIKVRERQRGKQQYQPLAEDGKDLIVREGGARLIVNLWRYLDTGLFLDHRPMRRYIHQHASGQDVLNLFCYTAAVTVQAALGGARRSVSVDLSNTYLSWARRNLELNDINTHEHQLIAMGCMEYLDQCRQDFDLIFLDPPTFSNSKSTSNVLDIQRDHATLIDSCMARLRSGGTLIFSNNMRRFKLDAELSERYVADDYHQASLDPDFARNPRIHQTWLIRHKS